MGSCDSSSRGRARIGFRQYLHTRKYDFGRGRAQSWQFIAAALGDPELPDATRWPELRDYLEARDHPRPLIESARVVWRSYQRNAPAA